MNRDEILNSLTFLKKGREALVSDFIKEEPRLYRSMFLYKPYSSDMNIAIDRYIFDWLSKHPSYQEINKEEKEITDPRLFLNAYRSLCQKFIIRNDADTKNEHEILEQLVKDSINIMDSLLAVSKNYDDQLERLRYQGEKSSHLFDRELAKLKNK